MSVITYCIGTGEENDEGIGLTVSNLFRSECCDSGTILHLAVEVSCGSLLYPSP